MGSTKEAKPTAQVQLAQDDLLRIHRITLTTFATQNAKALNFAILNDTIQLFSYNRAALFEIRQKKASLVGVSGQEKVPETSALALRWRRLVEALEEPESTKILDATSFKKNQKDWAKTVQEQGKTSVLWMPIYQQGETLVALWLERWGARPWTERDMALAQVIRQSYSLAWERWAPKRRWQQLAKGKLRIAGFAIFLSLFLVRVPLRVVAPCEVVPDDPLLITAPLDGIVEEISVTPGQFVEEESLLFSYDKRIPLQELEVAQRQVEIIQSEIHRATTQGYQDERSLAELSILRYRLAKERAKLALAEFQAEQLDVNSPAKGVVLLDNPEEWRGRPVQVGERVMVVSDPDATKVRMWIPVDDNVELDPEKPVKVILNIRPESSLRATLAYISSFSTMSDKQVPSFEAEASWPEDAPDVKMGLKGTAILYGDNVSLFYYLFRRPWAFFREFVGI